MTAKKKNKLDLILAKLTEHDRRFDEHDRRFDEHDRRFDNQDLKFEGIEKILYDHKHRSDKIEEKLDRKFDEVMTSLDKISGELEKTREDRVFAKAKDDEFDRCIRDLNLRLDKLAATR
jgi:hypothetical protein